MPLCSCRLCPFLAVDCTGVGSQKSWRWTRMRCGCVKTGPLGLSNGIMGEEGRGVEKLQWSAGNTPLLFFSLPRCSLSSSSSHSLTPSNSPHSPSLSLRCQRLSICSEMHSIHFQSPGFSSGAALILSEAVWTTSLTPLVLLCAFLPHNSPVLKGSKIMHFINPSRQLAEQITPQTLLPRSTFVGWIKVWLCKCKGTKISLNFLVFLVLTVQN